VPWAVLGEWPTPLDAIEVAGRAVWIKREGDSSPRYGGNKVRTLEPWLGRARARNASRIWAMGAYGSNHAVATVIHARAIGLASGAILFPQPSSVWARENAGALVASRVPIVNLRTVLEVPFVGRRLAARQRDAVVMPPGGATPLGALGALSAALELAEQIQQGAAPAPARIVLPIGSTCTTAGLLAGIFVARAVGAWRWPLPTIHGVRVTPWPVTSRVVVLRLASRTLAFLASIGGPDTGTARAELAAHLVIDGHELGAGYGRLTMRGQDARYLLASPRAPRLDGVYAAKAAAALLRLHRRGIGPLVFWATKSSVEMAGPRRDELAEAPAPLARWHARREDL
jgi:D-cysteine desulfhydrase